MKHVISACGHDFVERERHIGLLNKRKVVWGLARVLPREQVRELAMRVVRHPTRARKGIVNKMDQGGLILLNKVLVEAGARQIGRAMNVVTCGASKESEEEDGEGRVYFYCSAGKDRTGLLAALILRLLEVNEDDVIRDYARSQETWLNGPRKLRENYCARLEDAGLTPMNWLGAPPEVMEETLRYIKRRYGGIEDYMVHCGFEEERMNALREVMAPL